MKKKTANLLMVLAIAIIVVGGVLLAWSQIGRASCRERV